MLKAAMKDKIAIVSLLCSAFENNKSVNYIVRQDAKRAERIRSLMEYSFLTCMNNGKVLFSEDKKCCALVLFPDRKRTSLNSVWQDIKFIFAVTGLASVYNVLKREALIKTRHAEASSLYYIWFVGVSPDAQGMGLGTKMMEFLLSDAHRMKRQVYLETSTEANIPWYRKMGFQLYDELDLGYMLFFFRMLS